MIVQWTQQIDVVGESYGIGGREHARHKDLKKGHLKINWGPNEVAHFNLIVESDP